MVYAWVTLTTDSSGNLKTFVDTGAAALLTLFVVINARDRRRRVEAVRAQQPLGSVSSADSRVGHSRWLALGMFIPLAHIARASKGPSKT